MKLAVSYTTRPLYPRGKSPRHPLDRRLGGPQRRSGRGGEEENSLPLPGIEPRSPSRSLVTLLSEQPRLAHHSRDEQRNEENYRTGSVICFYL